MGREHQLAVVVRVHLVEQFNQVLRQHGMKAPVELVDHEHLVLALGEQDIHEVEQAPRAVRLVLEVERQQRPSVPRPQNRGFRLTGPFALDSHEEVLVANGQTEFVAVAFRGVGPQQLGNGEPDLGRDDLVELVHSDLLFAQSADACVEGREDLGHLVKRA